MDAWQEAFFPLHSVRPRTIIENGGTQWACANCYGHVRYKSPVGPIGDSSFSIFSDIRVDVGTHCTCSNKCPNHVKVKRPVGCYGLDPQHTLSVGSVCDPLSKVFLANNKGLRQNLPGPQALFLIDLTNSNEMPTTRD